MFRFKHFSVAHHRSSMKVGVDGVLIGCWADTEGASRILDVGTGCGLIALIMAQRCRQASILGIDIDEPSVEEAQENVKGSQWSERIEIVKASFPDDFNSGKFSHQRFDLIVSNPPYFNSGVTDAATPRELARHQGVLSPISLLRGGVQILNAGGGVAMVVPLEIAEETEAEAMRLGYALSRKCLVRGHSNAQWKRALLQWRFGHLPNGNYQGEETLTLEVSPGVPTDSYRRLCKDFYLKF